MIEPINSEQNPLDDLHQWEEDLLARYPHPENKKGKEFRNYNAEVRPCVKNFYQLNHENQTFEFVQKKRQEFLKFNQRKMGIWEAAEFLNNLVDDSDPDIDLPQIDHLFQTSEAIRKDGHPDWFVLTGFIHDLGKILCLFGEPQWAVVGDTFPVGCAFSDKIVFPEFFANNPDSKNSEYSTELGIYQKGCGLDQVFMSWGHDEYLYHVVKDFLPEEALYIIRYHSFYPGHREGEYDFLMNDHDREMFRWVRKFNPYDLYTKCTNQINRDEIRPYYDDLIRKYFPSELNW